MALKELIKIKIMMKIKNNLSGTVLIFIREINNIEIIFLNHL